MKKHFINISALFIVTFIIDLLWNAVLFAKFNAVNLAPIARIADGIIQPVFSYVLLADLLLVLGVTYFVPLGMSPTSSKTDYIKQGAFFVFIIYAIFGVVNHALLNTWPVSQIISDSIAGIVQGGLMGLTLYYLNRRTASTK